MAGHDWIVRGHELAPFVANRVKVGMANAAKEDLNLFAHRGPWDRAARLSL